MIPFINKIEKSELVICKLVNSLADAVASKGFSSLNAPKLAVEFEAPTSIQMCFSEHFAVLRLSTGACNSVTEMYKQYPDEGLEQSSRELRGTIIRKALKRDGVKSTLIDESDAPPILASLKDRPFAYALVKNELQKSSQMALREIWKLGRRSNGLYVVVTERDNDPASIQIIVFPRGGKKSTAKFYEQLVKLHLLISHNEQVDLFSSIHEQVVQAEQAVSQSSTPKSNDCTVSGKQCEGCKDCM